MTGTRQAFATLVLLPMLVSFGAVRVVTAQTGAVRSGDLWFDANASLGAFRGITHGAHGEMRGTALPSVRGFVEAASASLSTDNSLRDHDMRNTLEVEKYPTIRFDLDSVAVISEGADSSRVELLGRMSIHGVTKHIRIPAVVRRQAGHVRVTGSFDLQLPDYGITHLKRMLGTLTMNERIRVGLDVTFIPAHEGQGDTKS